MAFLYILVYKQARHADHRRHRENNDGCNIFLVTHGISAHGGRDHRGKPRKSRQQQIEGDAHVRQAHGISKHILGGTGDEEQDKHQGISLFRIADNRQAIHFFFGIKGINKSAAKPSHQQNNDNTSQHDPCHTKDGSPHRAKGISRGDLHQLSGHKSDHDLYRADQDQA